jgi:hypothetical protein
MSDTRHLTLRQADQARTDFAMIESNLEFIMGQLARMPTRAYRVRQKTPCAVGTGMSRGRSGITDVKPRYIWRNMIFRNLGAGLSSILIREALALTYFHWASRYGSLPLERLRSEIDVRRVRSTNPGFCYLMAGWERGETRNGKLFLWAPSP